MHEIDKQVSDVVISVFDVFVTTEIYHEIRAKVN